MGSLNKSLLVLLVSLAIGFAGGAMAAPEAIPGTVAATPAAVEMTPDTAHGAIDGAHAADAHTAAPAGDGAHQKKAGLPQLDPKWFPSQIFWLIVTFGIMYLGFSTIFLPQISKTIENRQGHIQGNLNKAQSLKEQAEAAQKKYEELLSGAFQQSWGMMEESEKDVKAKYDKAIAEFRKDSVKQVEELESQIANSKKKAMNDMHDVAAEMARAAAKKIVGIDADLTQVKNVVKNIDKKAA